MAHPFLHACRRPVRPSTTTCCSKPSPERKSAPRPAGLPFRSSTTLRPITVKDVEHLRQQERQAAQQREPAPTPASVSPWSKKGRNRLKQVVQQVQQSSSGPQLPPVPGLLGPDEVRRGEWETWGP